MYLDLVLLVNRCVPTIDLDPSQTNTGQAPRPIGLLGPAGFYISIHVHNVLKVAPSKYVSIYIYTEPQWPLLFQVNPSKQGLVQSKQGSCGF